MNAEWCLDMETWRHGESIYRWDMMNVEDMDGVYVYIYIWLYWELSLLGAERATSHRSKPAEFLAANLAAGNGRFDL